MGLPLMLDLTGRPVVVVGGGTVGRRKTAALLGAGAQVTVIDPADPADRDDPADRADPVGAAGPAGTRAGGIRWVTRRYRDGDLDGAWFAVAATDDPAVNEAVAGEAQARRIFCLRADRAEGGTAASPATTSAAEVTLAVWAGDPRRSRALRDAASTVLLSTPAPRSRPGGGELVLIADPGSDEELTVAARVAVNAADLVLGRGRSGPDPVELAAGGARVAVLLAGDPGELGDGLRRAAQDAGVPVRLLAGLPPAPVPGAPVVLAAHGTLDRAGQAAMAAQAELVAAAAPPGVEVHLGYIDDAGPSLREALDRAADVARAAPPPGRAPAVVVLPLLLGAASHSKTDIAGSVQAARARHPGLDIRYGRPLESAPALLEVARRRLDACGWQPGEQVLLVGAGSADPAANAASLANGRLLAEWLASPVEVAFAAAAQPAPGEALERLVRLGVTRLAVLPWLLAPGHFADRVLAVLAPLAAAAQVALHTAEPLGPDPAVATVVWERYAEALAGPVRMNCDVCLYRTPWPGREARVGAPQRPHAHPADPAR